MKRKTTIGERIRGWLPKSPSYSHQKTNMLSVGSFATKIALALRLVYGMVLIGLLFTPFAFYFSRAEPYFMGHIWGYQLPIGYVGLVLGLLAILSPKTIDRRLNFGITMVIIGFCLIISASLTPYDYFINLIHGTILPGGAIDVEYPIGHMITIYLGLFSIIVGLIAKVGTYQRHNMKNYFLD